MSVGCITITLKVYPVLNIKIKAGHFLCLCSTQHPTVGFMTRELERVQRKEPCPNKCVFSVHVIRRCGKPQKRVTTAGIRT
jgi:hypothetical protein